MDITINIKKLDVYDEVAKLTGYIGSKAAKDSGLTYDKVFTTEDDVDMLEQFWRDCKHDIVNVCKRFISIVTEPPSTQAVDAEEIFSLTMTMPSLFDISTGGAVQNNMRAYCINSISARWLAISNAAAAQTYITISQDDMRKITELIYYTKRPKRTPIIT